MLRQGPDRRGAQDEPNDTPSLPQQEDTRDAASNWQQEDASAAFYTTPDTQNAERDAAPDEALLELSEGYAGSTPPERYAEEAQTNAPAPDDAEDFYPLDGDEFAVEDDDEGWYDDQEYAEEDDERALALYETPQPPVRLGFVSRALLRLTGANREIANLEPRVTGPVLVPGSGKVAPPGAFGHTPLSPRAQRPRPFLMFVFVILFALTTVISTAWAAAPLDTQIQVYNQFSSLAGIQAPAATTTQDYQWYVVHYGDTLQSIASKFGVLPAGILLMNGLQDADQLYVGLNLKIPTDPTYGEGADVGVVDIPPPPPDKSGNVFGTNPWNSLSGPTDPDNICAPAGNSDTLADRQAFQLGAPNPHATFARGFTWYHNGVDLDNPAGTPILAAQAGMVVFAGWDTLGLGWSVKINHCNGLSTVYGHMEHPPLVKAGEYVTDLQQIGVEGSTGDSTGPHLHFMTEWWNKAANPYCFDFALPAGNTPCNPS